MTRTVVVLGANYAGLSSAHYFLKHVLPQLPNKDDYTLTLVGPSAKFYARPTSPRADLNRDHTQRQKWPG